MTLDTHEGYKEPVWYYFLIGLAIIASFTLCFQIFSTHAQTFPVDTNGTLTNGLQAYYKLDEPPDQLRLNSFGTHNLDFHNVSTTFGEYIGNSAFFTPASGSFLYDGNNYDELGGASFSFAFWFRSTAYSANTGIIKKGEFFNNAGFNVYKSSSGNNNRIVAKLTTSTGNFIETDSDLNPLVGFPQGWADGFWHLVVIRYDNSKTEAGLDVIMDGAFASTGIDGGSTGVFNGFNNTDVFKIGAETNAGNGEFMNGEIDEVGIWYKRLSNQEITDLYNNGVGESVPFPQEPNPTSTASYPFANQDFGVFGNLFRDLMVWLFVPQQSTLNQYGSLITTTQNKPPFGYFTAVKNSFSQLSSASANITLNLTGFTIISDIRTGFVWLLWLFFAIFLLKRFIHFDF